MIGVDRREMLINALHGSLIGDCRGLPVVRVCYMQCALLYVVATRYTRPSSSLSSASVERTGPDASMLTDEIRGIYGRPASAKVPRATRREGGGSRCARLDEGNDDECQTPITRWICNARF